MDATARPAVHVLVGWLEDHMGLISQPKAMLLEEAVEYARLGFVVMRDPFDLDDLTRYEQIERSRIQSKSKWFERA